MRLELTYNPDTSMVGVRLHEHTLSENNTGDDQSHYKSAAWGHNILSLGIIVEHYILYIIPTHLVFMKCLYHNGWYVVRKQINYAVV